ncbi:MAG: FadR/GntR family transcriptional regulator [Rhodothermales bacterium]
MPKHKTRELTAELRRRIDDGEWRTEGTLPSERQLAEELGVARNTVRSAVAMLREEGTLVSEVGRGTFLTSRNDWSLAGIIRRMRDASPADMMEVRLILEPMAAAMAATAGSISDFDAIAAAHWSAIATSDPAEFEEQDTAFHQHIFACTGNELLNELHNLVCRLRSQPQWHAMKQRTATPERLKLYGEQHAVILYALRCRDPESAKVAMIAHLTTVQSVLLGR